MCIKFEDLEITIQNRIPKSLKPYFNKITFDNRLDWIMIIHYGPYELIESFNDLRMELYEDYAAEEIVEIFEKHKLGLFLDGIYLYYRESIENIRLVCDAYDEHYDLIR